MSDNVWCILKGCDNRLSGRQRKYCSKSCRDKMRTKRYRARQEGREVAEKTKPVNQNFSDGSGTKGQRASRRAGPGYTRFVEEGYAPMVANGQMSSTEAAEAMGTTPANVSRWLAQFNHELQLASEQEDWDEPELLQLPDRDLWDGTSDPDLHPELADDDPYWSAIEQLIDKLAAWRAEYFIVPETGKPYQTPPHQRRWYRRWFHALIQGSREGVLATPRHGKTEGLMHFDIFVITHINPNIRIIHIGGNTGQSEEFVSAVLDVLENNERLIEDFCGPGKTFKPATRSGKTWSKSRLTVATRTITGMKAPTLAAVGRQGHLPSKDADIIQFDDIEDTGSTAQPSGREETRRWFIIDLSSRKESHTAVLGIGQRVHRDDLLGHLIDNPQWNCTVDRAHDEERCTVVDPENPANWHKHQVCMLWPTKNDFEWLMEHKMSAEIEGGHSFYEMVYLNRVEGEGASGFDREHLHACRNHTRAIGQKPDGARLVAGLDPAPIGMQAAVLWAWAEGRMWLIDLEIQEGGGIQGALRLVKAWNEMYGCGLWVFEKNAQQSMYLKDEKIRDYCQTNGITVRPHQTQTNRDDERFGVPGMARLTKPNSDGVRIIDLPYADTRSMQKTDVLIRQWTNWGGPPSKNARKGPKTDVAMAAWFPYFAVIRNWMRQDTSDDSNVVSVNFERGYGTPTSMRPTSYVPSVFGRSRQNA